LKFDDGKTAKAYKTDSQLFPKKCEKKLQIITGDADSRKMEAQLKKYFMLIPCKCLQCGKMYDGGKALRDSRKLNIHRDVKYNPLQFCSAKCANGYNKAQDKKQ